MVSLPRLHGWNCPVSLWYVPAEHAVQSCRPKIGWRQPFGHKVHVVDDFASWSNVPGTHGVHVVAPSATFVTFPAAQG